MAGYVPSSTGTIPLATTGSSLTSRDNSVSSLSLDIPPSSPLTASFDVPSSSQLYPLGFPGPVNDPAHFAFDKNDIIIAVMGHTGAGKSSFVNIAAGPGNPGAVVGHGLKPQTHTVNPVRCAHPDGRRNIVLMDTPGFDDTYLPDAHILKVTADWLNETYQGNVKLTGILYLHRISDVRVIGVPRRNMTAFRDLCGDRSTKNIVLVTTMWDSEDPLVGSEREKELLSKYWKDMVYLGSSTCRFLGTHASAWKIIDRLIFEGSRRATPSIQNNCTQPRETFAAEVIIRFLAHECRKVWTRIRRGVRGRRVPSRVYQLHTISAPTLGSGISRTGRSILSLASGPFSSAESTFSGCSACRCRDMLVTTIQGLKVGDIEYVPALQESIGIVLEIAQIIEGMGGVHHAIGDIVEHSGRLIKDIAHTTGCRISEDMTKVLNLFRKELENLRRAVKMVSTRDVFSRFLLHNADIQVISACVTAIGATYGKLGAEMALDNLEAITRLGDQLTRLRDSQAALQCECGRLVIREESQECSPSTSQSS